VVNIGGFDSSLRERKEDIPILIDYFIDEMNRRFNASIRCFIQVPSKSLRIIHGKAIFRELKNSIEYALTFATVIP
jgi:transcriptional regulator with AAA-type ATPase domain